ncbi:hypothetical protein FRB90_011913 [Tulasnella sp. 427]|nr:hypothetical protein FRB90_011913 [Tulasnella sp. 427]
MAFHNSSTALDDDLVDVMSSVSTTFSDSSPSPATPKLQPDDSFSGFQEVEGVGDALYRVPRTLIQHAEALKLLPVDRASGALCLHNITPKEMEAFLDVADARLLTGDNHYTSDQWVGALAVANPLGISQVRNYAIPKLQESPDRLDPFARIGLADKYRVDEWMAQPVVSICERLDPLSEPKCFAWEQNGLALSLG